MKFSIKKFFSKCDQIRRFLQIWSHLLKKSLMGNFIVCAVFNILLFFIFGSSFKYTPMVTLQIRKMFSQWNRASFRFPLKIFLKRKLNFIWNDGRGRGRMIPEAYSKLCQHLKWAFTKIFSQNYIHKTRHLRYLADFEYASSSRVPHYLDSMLINTGARPGRIH